MTTQQLTCTRPVQTVGFPTIIRRIILATAARRQRKALARLDDSMLADIGITRAEALAEARRSAWDVPAHWRR